MRVHVCLWVSLMLVLMMDRVGGAFGRLPLFNGPPTKCFWIRITRRLIPAACLLRGGAGGPEGGGGGWQMTPLLLYFGAAGAQKIFLGALAEKANDMPFDSSTQPDRTALSACQLRGAAPPRPPACTPVDTPLQVGKNEVAEQQGTCFEQKAGMCVPNNMVIRERPVPCAGPPP